MKASSSNERETTEAKLQPIHFRIGSSETTRESPLSSSETEKVSSSFNFDDFLHNHLPEHKTGVDTDFLEWFIGFVEGDGTFSSRLVDSTSAKKRDGSLGQRHFFAFYFVITLYGRRGWPSNPKETTLLVSNLSKGSKGVAQDSYRPRIWKGLRIRR